MRLLRYFCVNKYSLMAKKITETLGDRLQQLRKEAGYTQSELAKMIDISHTQIARYELKGVQPPADILNKMADVFGISIDFLVRGEKNKYATETINDAELVNQFKLLSDLPKEEKSLIVKFVGAYIRDYKAKQAYA
jgi:transcriptional regulator with XRE-family HTH domain